MFMDWKSQVVKMSILLKKSQYTFFFFFFSPCLWHVEVSVPGIKLSLLQRQCPILNPLCHSREPQKSIQSWSKSQQAVHRNWWAASEIHMEMQQVLKKNKTGGLTAPDLETYYKDNVFFF